MQKTVQVMFYNPWTELCKCTHSSDQLVYFRVSTLLDRFVHFPLVVQQFLFHVLMTIINNGVEPIDKISIEV